MKLSPETLERHAQRAQERQPDLPNMPPPMTANRAKDFAKCKVCQVQCDYCLTPERH